MTTCRGQLGRIDLYQLQDNGHISNRYLLRAMRVNDDLISPAASQLNHYLNLAHCFRRSPKTTETIASIRFGKKAFPRPAPISSDILGDWSQKRPLQPWASSWELRAAKYVVFENHYTWPPERIMIRLKRFVVDSPILDLGLSTWVHASISRRQASRESRTVMPLQQSFLDKNNQPGKT